MLSFLILCGILYGAAAVVSSAPDAVCAVRSPDVSGMASMVSLVFSAVVPACVLPAP